MPNWTTNRLEFSSAEEARKVWDGMQIDNADGAQKRLSFEAVIPSPRTKEECPSNYLMNETSQLIAEKNRPWFNWQAWNCDNWGIKWDASDAFYDTNVIYFNTPWNPPFDSLFQKIADTFDVQFTLAVENEDGGWQENDYIFSPGKEMITKPSEWQRKANADYLTEW